MPLITTRQPETWEELEELTAAILAECGMKASRQTDLALPRGSVRVDVAATHTVSQIEYQILCECKNWQTRIPKEVVHAFRTVMHETGAHLGYIISRIGFQDGAWEAARATNIRLVTFDQFQELYFDTWLQQRIVDIEDTVGDFNVYYEPLGKPGYSKLSSPEERKAYDEVWHRYLFAGLLLVPFSPYAAVLGKREPPQLSVELSRLAALNISVPTNLKGNLGYREFLQELSDYAREGLADLRGVNPITKGKAPSEITRDD